jgi:starch synthase
VASAVDGVPEVVEHGVTGLLVPSLDARMFAEGLRRIFDERDTAAAWGEAGYQRARRLFSLETWAQRTADLYRRVCGR